MVVHHPDVFHQSVGRSRPGEFEAALFKVDAQIIRFTPPYALGVVLQQSLIIRKSPDVIAKTAKFLLHLYKATGIFDNAINFLEITHHPFGMHQSVDFKLVVSRDPADIPIVEGRFKYRSFF